MKHLLLLVLFCLPGLVVAQDDDPLQPLKDIRKERRSLNTKYNKLKSDAESDDDLERIAKNRATEEQALVEKTIRLCRELDGEAEEVKTLSYLTRFCEGDARDLAAKALAIDYMESRSLGDWIDDIASIRTPHPYIEKWLRAVKDKSPHRTVQGKATFALLQHMKKLADASPSTRKKLAKQIGDEGTEYLASRSQKKCDQAVEWLAKVCEEEFATIKLGRLRAGTVAKEILRAKRFAVGKIAP